MSQIKKLRELSGLTQTELSNLSRIDRSRLSLAESGQVKLSATETETVRKVLLRQMEKRASLIQDELERNGSLTQEVIAV